jgi:glycosyltransferase involved in cell wall biosynthesis
MNVDAGGEGAPLVSIVTPTLNRAGLLEMTLRSVRNQNYPNIEHIVVDGGSTDGTVALLTSMVGTYPLRWTSRTDSGMYEAINEGLATSRGSILAYLNSGDLYFPWTIGMVVRQFQRHRSVDFVYGDALSIDDASAVRHVYWQHPFHRDTVQRTGFLAQPTVFWRRKVMDTLGGFDESLRYVADCDYWMRAADRFRFRKVHEVLAVERQHGETLRETESGVWTELERVRSRYVQLSGWRNRLRHQRNRRRMQLLDRFYSLAFLCQSRLPWRATRGPWARFLAADETNIDLAETLRFLLPRHHDSTNRIMAPDRRWLEPPG